MGQVVLVDFKKRKIIEVVKKPVERNTCSYCGKYALADNCCFACYDALYEGGL